MKGAARLFAVALTIIASGLGATAQTLNGVTLGEPLPATLPPPDDAVAANGNFFLHWDIGDSLTMSIWAVEETGPVLSVQVARVGSYGRPDSPFPDTQFGVTSAAQIERRFGPSGPVYEIAGAQNAFADLVTYNLSYEIDTGDWVLTFITLESAQQPDTVGRENSRLDAVIIADRAFQEVFWGTPTYPRQGYEPIPDPF